MVKVGFTNAVKLIMRGCSNFITKKPLVVSFEVTSSCNADCLHCDKGGIIEGEERLTPAEIARFYRKLRPVAVQLSGGEPLLRDDILDIARAIKEPGGAPYIILVTNGFLLERDIYHRLREAGVNQFSISLDFPDERHDQFRQLSGLYRHLEEMVPELTALGNDDIVFNTAISKENLDVLPDLCRKATEWGASMSYSAYSPLRTGNRDFLISDPVDMEKLRETLDELIGMKRDGYRIRNTVSILENTYRYFQDGGIGGCKAGYRFLLITPEGYHRPCAHKRVKFHSQKELIEGFARTNDCRGCYVAIRSYCDKSFLSLVREQVISRIIPQT